MPGPFGACNRHNRKEIPISKRYALRRAPAIFYRISFIKKFCLRYKKYAYSIYYQSPFMKSQNSHCPTNSKLIITNLSTFWRITEIIFPLGQTTLASPISLLFYFLVNPYVSLLNQNLAVVSINSSIASNYFQFSFVIIQILLDSTLKTLKDR